uniref:Uncharacterized protein n=1 Tax=Lotharella globosa TaxID=91324 RepID=A0A7S3YXJ0_9EUKA
MCPKQPRVMGYGRNTNVIVTWYSPLPRTSKLKMLLVVLFALATPVSGAWKEGHNALLPNATSGAGSTPLHLIILLDKDKARGRWESIMMQAKTHNLLVHPLPYLDVNNFENKQYLTQQSLKNILQEAQELNVPDEEVLVFAQDDTVFHDNLRSELEESLASLPQNWQVFHMCPRDLTKGTTQYSHTEPVPFKLTRTEEYEATQPEANEKHPRYYDVRLMQFMARERVNAFLGGPVSFATKKKYIPRLSEKLEDLMGRKINDDQCLMMMTDKYSFASREPQMCMSGGFQTSFQL